MTFRRVRLTIVAVEKELVLRILSVCVALVNQHTKHTCLIVLSSVAGLALLCFTTFSHKRQILRKQIFLTENCVSLLFPQYLAQTFLSLRRIERNIIINVHGSSRNLLVRFSGNLRFLNSFSKNTQISNVLKIGPLRAQSFHLDGQTDMKKLIVAFRNFVNSPIQDTN